MRSDSVIIVLASCSLPLSFPDLFQWPTLEQEQEVKFRVQRSPMSTILLFTSESDLMLGLTKTNLQAKHNCKITDYPSIAVGLPESE